MKKFERPEIKITLFAAENVATTSGPTTQSAYDGAKSWLTDTKNVDSSNIADFFSDE